MTATESAPARARAVTQPTSVSRIADQVLEQAVSALDLDALAREFDEQGQFLFVPRFLPARAVDDMLRELGRFRAADVHRTYLPWIRKAGTVGQRAIARQAPFLHALYRSQVMLDFATRLAGAPLALKNDSDAHAAALYLYQRPGDHVAFHYDDCGCEDAASYTATFGLVNRTQSRVHFQLFRNHPTRPMRELYLSMQPGSLVFFCGSKAYHRVTPLGAGEERVTYSFAYVRQGKRLRGYRRLVENLKDAVLYFGPKAIFQKNYR